MKFYLFYQFGTAQKGDYAAKFLEFDTQEQAEIEKKRITQEQGYNALEVRMIKGQEVY